MHSGISPLPVLLLSKVVGDIREGCYLLLRACLLWRPSHLRQDLKKQFVDVFNKNSTIHWLLVTLVCGAWWCHHGRWRSGPRHLSPQSRACTDDSHCKVIHSFTRSFPFTHSHSEKKPKNKTQNSPSMMHSASSPLPVLLLSNVVDDIHKGCSSRLYFRGLLT